MNFMQVKQPAITKEARNVIEFDGSIPYTCRTMTGQSYTATMSWAQDTATSPPPACLTTHQPVAPTPILLRHTQIHRHNTKAPPRRHAVVTCKTHHDSTPMRAMSLLPLSRCLATRQPVAPASIRTPRKSSTTLLCEALTRRYAVATRKTHYDSTLNTVRKSHYHANSLPTSPVVMPPKHGTQDFTCTNMACKSLPTTPRQHRLRDDYGYKDEDDGCNEKNDGSKGNGNGTSVTPAPRQQH
ncbi:hypothetical protein EDB85DRAFT_1897295 [Lactarius pseudohatsudake]|nr:hypothetical protein EDB85DRAFT_1897295 [Lactarius pseudohatsudake]